MNVLLIVGSVINVVGFCYGAYCFFEGPVDRWLRKRCGLPAKVHEEAR